MKYTLLKMKKISYPVNLVNPIKKISTSLLLTFFTFNLLAEPSLASNSGEFLILKNGSVIKGKTTKLDSKKSELLFSRQGTEFTIPLKFIQAISFQGSYYPPKDLAVGFHLSNSKSYEGQPSYFTSTMIGRSKPSKMRFKKNVLDFLILSNEQSTQPIIKVYTVSREIIFCNSFNEADRKVQTPIGQLSLHNSQVIKVEDLSGVSRLGESHSFQTSAQPFLNSIIEPQLNKTFGGQPLQVNGFPTKHFISLHTRTEMRFQLPPKSKRFTASAFIDPQAINGDLNLIISQNAKELYKAKITSGQAPQEINIPVKASELKITADFGKRGSAGDFLILANPQISEVN